MLAATEKASSNSQRWSIIVYILGWVISSCQVCEKSKLCTKVLKFIINREKEAPSILDNFHIQPINKTAMSRD